MDAIGVIIYELLVNKEYQAFNIAVNAFYTKYRGTEIWDYVLVHAVQKNNMDIVKFVLEEKKSLKMTRFDRVVVENEVAMCICVPSSEFTSLNTLSALISTSGELDLD